MRMGEETMTMRERIAAGKLFTDYCEGLPEDRTRCKIAMTEFNNSLLTEIPARMEAMKKLFGKQMEVWIEPPFYC